MNTERLLSCGNQDVGQEFLIYRVAQSGSSCLMYIKKKVASEFFICHNFCLAHTISLVCLKVVLNSSYLIHCLTVLPISFDVVICSSIYNILCSSIICYIMSWLFILD